MAGRAALLATAVLAAVVPLTLYFFVEGPMRRGAEARLGKGLGEKVTIAGAEAELVGTFRLDGVAVGERFAADSVEASIGLASLLSGSFGADELRVERPRIRARVQRDGTLDAVELLRRVRDARGGSGVGASSTSAGRLRRIVVTRGELVVTVDGGGEIRARGVEIHPRDGGVRVVTAGTTIRAARGGWSADAAFERAGVDVTLPDLQVTRAALDGGTLRVAHEGSPPLTLDRLVLLSGVDDGDTARLEAHVAARPERVSIRVKRTGAALRIEAETDGLDLAAFASAFPRAIDVAGGRIVGRVVVESAGAELRIGGDARISGWRVSHHLIDDTPVPLDARIAGDAVWSAGGEGHAAFKVERDALAFDVEAEVALGADGTLDRFAARVDLPETQCAGALAAIPIELRRGIDGLELSGTIRASVDVAADRAAPRATRLDLDLAMKCKVDRDPAVADAGALRRAYSHMLPDGTLRLMGAHDGDFVALATLPSRVAEAWVAAEDARFRRHAGFDPDQIRKSLAHDVASGQVARGGSTISQQLVKNLWLSRERTLSRKLTEALLTWRLEQRVGKDRILEVYLNLVELGDGVYGLGPAARRWFGKPARDLDVAETAFLAALTPAPLSSERRIRAAGRLDDETRKRVEVVLRAMRRGHVITEDERKHAQEKLRSLHVRVNAS